MKKRVAISGLSLFSAQIADLVNRYESDWEACLLGTDTRYQVLSAMYNLNQCDVWYTIGTPRTDGRLEALAKALRKPRILHWVGSDIAAVRNDTGIRNALQDSSFTHLAEVSWTQAELAEMAIKAQIAPLPPRTARNGPPPPLPDRFTVLLYVPRTRGDFYGSPMFERLIEEFRDEPIDFLIVGGGELNTSNPNVTNLGWRESLSEVYDRSSVLVRLTPRDGLSLMVLEALSLGRYVLWSKPFPFVLTVANYEDIRYRLRSLGRQHLLGNLSLQADAAEFIQAHYAPEHCIHRIASAWDAALSGARKTSRDSVHPAPLRANGDAEFR